jgi:hypothetical protein
MRTNSNDSKDLYETEPDPDKEKSQEESGKKENLDNSEAKPENEGWDEEEADQGSIRHSFEEDEESEAVEDYISPENEQISTLLIDRLNKIRKRRPILVANMVEIINDKSNEVEDSIRYLETIPQYLDKIFVETEANHCCFDLCNRVERKIKSFLEIGASLDYAWEDKFEREQRNLRFLEEARGIRYVVLDREDIKVIERHKQEYAGDFSKKMAQESLQIAEKRKQLLVRVEEEQGLEAQRLVEEERQKRLEKLRQGRVKAVEFMEGLKLQRRMRKEDVAARNEKFKQVLKVQPLYQKVDREYKLEEDLMYNSRGATLEQLERFKKEQKLFHFFRNKKNFFEVDKSSDFGVQLKVNRSVMSGVKQKGHLSRVSEVDLDRSYQPTRYAKQELRKIYKG